jgi:hypothetical protein
MLVPWAARELGLRNRYPRGNAFLSKNGTSCRCRIEKTELFFFSPSKYFYLVLVVYI